MTINSLNHCYFKGNFGLTKKTVAEKKFRRQNFKEKSSLFHPLILTFCPMLGCVFFVSTNLSGIVKSMPIVLWRMHQLDCAKYIKNKKSTCWWHILYNSIDAFSNNVIDAKNTFRLTHSLHLNSNLLTRKTHIIARDFNLLLSSRFLNDFRLVFSHCYSWSAASI